MDTYVSKWAKGDTVHIDGKCYLLTNKPKKAIDGSWVVFTSDRNGKVSMTYVMETEQKGTYNLSLMNNSEGK